MARTITGTAKPISGQTVIIKNLSPDQTVTLVSVGRGRKVVLRYGEAGEVVVGKSGRILRARRVSIE